MRSCLSLAGRIVAALRPVGLWRLALIATDGSRARLFDWMFAESCNFPLRYCPARGQLHFFIHLGFTPMRLCLRVLLALGKMVAEAFMGASGVSGDFFVSAIFGAGGLMALVLG